MMMPKSFRYLILAALLASAPASYLLDAQSRVNPSAEIAIEAENINIDLSGVSTESEQQAQTALLTTMDADTSAVAATIDGSAGAIKVLLVDENGDPSLIEIDTSGLATETTLGAINNKLPALDDGRVPVAISGTIEVGDLEVGAQPADDPHYVACSNGSIAAPCDVTLAADDPGVAAIIAAIGNTVTVTGSVTANAGTNLNTSALLTTSAFNTVFGSSSLILTTQADNLANSSDGLQTTGFNYVYDGSTWDRWTGAVTVAGVATAANQSTANTALQLIDNPVGSLTGGTAGTSSFAAGGIYTSSPPTLTNNQQSALRLSSAGRVLADVDCSNCTGSFPEEVIEGGDVDGIRSYLVNGDGDPLSVASDAVFGTTTYTETSSSGPIMGAVRNDTLAALANTDNEVAPLQVNAAGALYVEAALSAVDNAVLDSIDAATGTAASALTTLVSYLQPGTGVLIRSDNTNNDDETQIKATAGVLLAISGRNSSEDTDAYVRCTNATAANTTPGSTTVIYEMMLPFGGGFVQGSLGPGGMAFSTALTCYIATGEAVSDNTDAAQNDVVVNVVYR